MVYEPRPNSSGDTLDQSRDQIRTNFQIIQTDFAVDHVGFDETNEGKHKQSTYPELATTGAGDGPTTAANESAIWSLEGPSGETEIYMRRENTSGVWEVPTKDLAIFGVAAAGLFDATGAALGSHNVNMTCARISLGNFNCSFTNAMPNANYMVVISAQNTTASVLPTLVTWRINAKSTTAIQIIFVSETSGGTRALFDPDSFNVIVYGGIQ